jgi:uncharacterized protein (DUF433 family)
MINETNIVNDSRYRPIYTLNEAARYLRVNKITLKTWALGRTYKNSGQNVISEPLFRPASIKGAEKLSFMNLLEAHILAALRQTHRIPMSRVRTAIDWLKQHRTSDHPLLEIDIATDGLNLFIIELGNIISISEHGQIVIKEIMEKYLDRIERDHTGIPIQFYPFTRAPEASECPRKIVINPEIAFGRPVIQGTRISTNLICERYAAGESVIELAHDYQIEPAEVDEAIRCQIPKAA